MSIQVYELTNLGVRVLYSMEMRQKPEQVTQHKDLILSNCSHKHPCYELHVIEEGSMQMLFDDIAYTLNAGQLCLVCPGTMHAAISDIPKVRRFCLSFELLPEAAPLSAFMIRLSSQSGRLIADAHELLPIIHQLRSIKCSSSLFSEELICSLLSQLLVQLARSVAAAPAETTLPNSNLSEVRIFHIDDFFNNRFYCSESEDALAEELGVSRRQLNRIVQSIYAKSFREKLQEVRVEAACELLKENLPIREIAERLGYSTCSNFSVFFKRTMGVTPSEYRRKNQL